MQFDANGYLWALIHLICVGKSFSFGKIIRRRKCVGEANQLYYEVIDIEGS